MTTVDLILGIVMAFTTIGGFMFEWRRSNRRDEEFAELRGRVDAHENRLGYVEGVLDRQRRSW